MIARTARFGVLHYPCQTLYTDNVIRAADRCKFFLQVASVTTLNADLVHTTDIKFRLWSERIATQTYMITRLKHFRLAISAQSTATNRELQEAVVIVHSGATLALPFE